MHNFSLFTEMMKTQKLMSPAFPASECALRMSVYATQVGGQEHLSLCLESKDTEKGGGAGAGGERSCWCLFRMSVLCVVGAAPGGAPSAVHRDSYGRFAADTRGGDNTSLGWNDFTPMSSFLSPDSGFLLDDTATFSVLFHVIRESCSFTRQPLLTAAASAAGGGGGKGGRGKGGAGGGQLMPPPLPSLSSEMVHAGKFVWKISHFTRLKDLLK